MITFLNQVKFSRNSRFKQKRLVWENRKFEIMKQVPNYLMNSQIYVRTSLGSLSVDYFSVCYWIIPTFELWRDVMLYKLFQM